MRRAIGAAGCMRDTELGSEKLKPVGEKVETRKSDFG
jgi:hypothetical protein